MPRQLTHQLSVAHGCYAPFRDERYVIRLRVPLLLDEPRAHQPVAHQRELESLRRTLDPENIHRPASKGLLQGLLGHRHHRLRCLLVCHRRPHYRHCPVRGLDRGDHHALAWLLHLCRLRLNRNRLCLHRRWLRLRLRRLRLHRRWLRLHLHRLRRHRHRRSHSRGSCVPLIHRRRPSERVVAQAIQDVPKLTLVAKPTGLALAEPDTYLPDVPELAGLLLR